ncbi:multidrug efflux RND transporter permease subunit [Sphingomonas melonis TY]|jgi:multidrug efflux pump|uniref:Efflux pump membrane transporter n=1 Tax=Sphingomonas melonis TY TaxID=621456 RepID=A0A175Y7N6_9SPHN|nr:MULTISPECIES: efflux RND transporter permease subunit [Sphingomonas]AOW24078.1 multidrug efflux RND transporter permease [Sphingomonas melonis TY]ATI55120.1 multidrug efflux RND transporter permease subunit [Sphingomonas melonis]KZB96505.1 multidrug efflux RND transporter permease subunit [Sphingomonas melonis TY]MBI0532811.1 multidrug efflux RND transporter permease subunit [Sphingomonas sp. TX0522]MBX8843591.1 efflux RND transporter permease subunit [Sphingomonas melonis]
MARYFIDRPIFAWVIAIVMMLAGAIAIRSLPVAQFPEIAPPAVAITASYPGADAETLERTTTQIIEQQLKGIDNLRYFSSSSSSAGTVTITLTFEQGTNPDIAQVQVQNKLQAATPLLPQEVQRQGIQVTKSSASFLLVVGLVSTDGSHSNTDLSDMVVSKFQDPISRVSGVGELQVFGAQYAMRIWLDPIKLNSYALTVADVTSAVQAQNAQVSAGQIGAQPAPKSQMLNATVSVQSRLQTPEQFGAIRLKTTTAGAVVRLRDVARVELGAENYGFDVQYNGKPASGFGVRLAAGANALDTVELVKARAQEIGKTLPADVKVIYPYDTTPFVRLSVEQVIHTLIEAVVLVFLVMFLFLQNWRATLIPTIAVPVVLLGTFAVMAVAGFTINTLTLFGMVLAIGLLVDDAIVVVENVERLIVTEHLSPKDAARKSMDEISGALIGIGLVLSAVFLPMAFFGGSTGVIYRQFSITIVSAMVLSVMVALILTPALCATILKPHDPNKAEGNGPFARFFRWFNDRFERGQQKYEGGVKRTARSWKRSLLVYALIVGGMVLVFTRLPSGFLPDEDQGTVLALVQGPAGATSARTDKGLTLVRDHFMKAEGANVAGVFTINGFSFAGQGQNAGLVFVNLKPWDERSGADNKAQAIVGRAMGAFSQYKDGLIFALVPPAVQELGNATGFDAQLVDTGGIGHEKLVQARNMMLGMAMQDKRLAQVRPLSLDDAPQLKVKIDEDKARALGLDLADVNSTIATAWGGGYINDFIDRGRVKRVYVQADAPYRLSPEDVGDLYVRNGTGQMVPFTAFATLEWANAPVQLTRYNGQPAMQLQGSPGPGLSTGAAMQAMEEIHAKLPPGTALEWTGLSFEERLSGGQAPALYGLSLLIVFLCLAALYESWSVPISVMLVVPLGVLGAVLAAWLTGLNNDIYLQVGLITTIGVSAKNAILIVEFAEERINEGMRPFDAAVEAAKLRLRPILMTSLAFIFGVLPLAISTGAGAGGQNAIGRAVVGGMLSATLLAIFFVPMFFVVVLRLFGHGHDGKRPVEDRQHDSNDADGEGDAPRPQGA